MDVRKEWGAVYAGDVSGAWGHVDEAQDLWTGHGGPWGAAQHVAWAWCIWGHGMGVEMNLEAIKPQAWAWFIEGCNVGC